jgi:glycosyltransferase involved in cell wall biosynthesis
LFRARRQRIPLVFNTTMMPEPSSAALPARTKERLLIAVAMRLLARVIAQTQRTKAELQARAWLPSSQVDVIGNGVDLGLFQPATAGQRATARQRFGIPDDAGPIYLMVGSLIPRKGLHHLLEAWPQVLATQPSARLLVAGGSGQRLTGDSAGTTHSPYVEKIHRQIAALPQPDSVQLLGSVVDTHVCYHAADIFAFASEREGLPNVVLEAMACGLPCLLADYAGIPAEGEELGTSGQQHLHCARSAQELASGMVRLGHEPGLRAQMGQAARQWMVATQDLERILDQWAALYRRVAGPDSISHSPLRGHVIRP